MDSARGGLEQSGLLVGQVVDLVHLGLVILDVVGKTTVHGHTGRTERLAHQALAAATVKAVATSHTDISDTLVALGETSDVLAPSNDVSDSLVSWNELDKSVSASTVFLVCSRGIWR